MEDKKKNQVGKQKEKTKRNKEIKKLAKQRVPYSYIANKYKISKKRVHDIIHDID